MGSIRSGLGQLGDGLTPNKVIKITDAVMRAAERVSATALCDIRCRNGHNKADPLKIMDVAQQSFAQARKLQDQAEVHRQTLELAASTMDKFECFCEDEGEAVSSEEAVALALNDGGIEDAIEVLLEERGPLTGDQICEALKGRFSQRNVEKIGIRNLRKSKAIVGAALHGNPPVWASVERGINLDEIPGYKEAADRLALIRDLYSQKLKRSEVAERVGVTVEEINRWKYRGGIAVIWY